MGLPNWPEELPLPLLRGFSVAGTPSQVRTEMESGPDRVTRISSVTPRQISAGFVFTAHQSEVFWRFFEGDANGGADWVLIPIDTGLGVAPHRVRFEGVPQQKKLSGNLYELNCSIETDEQRSEYGLL